MFQFDYASAYGAPTTVALARTAYCTGNTAIMMVCADPRDGSFGEFFGNLSVNIPDDFGARHWTSVDDDHFVLDTNNIPEDVILCLIDAEIIEVEPAYAVSGFCFYPLASLTEKGAGLVPTYEDLMRSLSAKA